MFAEREIVYSLVSVYESMSIAYCERCAPLAANNHEALFVMLMNPETGRPRSFGLVLFQEVGYDLCAHVRICATEMGAFYRQDRER